MGVFVSPMDIFARFENCSLIFITFYRSEISVIAYDICCSSIEAYVKAVASFLLSWVQLLLHVQTVPPILLPQSPLQISSLRLIYYIHKDGGNAATVKSISCSWDEVISS